MLLGKQYTVFNSYPLALNGLGEVLERSDTYFLIWERLRYESPNIDENKFRSIFGQFWAKYRVTKDRVALTKKEQDAIAADIQKIVLSVFGWVDALTFQGVAKGLSEDGWLVIPIGRAPAAVTKAPAVVQAPAETLPGFVGPPAPAKLQKQEPIQVADIATKTAPTPTPEQERKASAAGISPLILAMIQQSNPKVQQQSTSQIVADLKSGKYDKVLRAKVYGAKGSGTTWVVPVLLIGAVGISVFLGIALGARYTDGAPKR